MGRRDLSEVQTGAYKVGEIRKASIANSSTDFFSSDLSVTSIGEIVIELQVSVAAKVSLRLTKSADVDDGKLNGDVALAADTWYSFKHPVNGEESINFRHDQVSAVIVTCRVYFQEHIR